MFGSIASIVFRTGGNQRGGIAGRAQRERQEADRAFVLTRLASSSHRGIASTAGSRRRSPAPARRSPLPGAHPRPRRRPSSGRLRLAEMPVHRLADRIRLAEVTLRRRSIDHDRTAALAAMSRRREIASLQQRHAHRRQKSVAHRSRADAARPASRRASGPAARTCRCTAPRRSTGRAARSRRHCTPGLARNRVSSVSIVSPLRAVEYVVREAAD